jgi:Na+/H+-translocating membrane pyrophosphatase
MATTVPALGPAADPQVPPAEPAANGGASSPGPVTPGQLVLLLVAMGAVLSVILAAFFHYAAKDATSVLGVVLPAITALVGGFVGHQAGASAGAASTKAADSKLSAASQAIDAMSGAVADLAVSGASVVNAIQTAMHSPEGQGYFAIPNAVEGTPTIEAKALSDLGASIAHIQTGLATAAATLRT